MRPLLLALAFVLTLPFSSAPAQQPAAPTQPAPAAEAIMARVAANQDQSEAERAYYVYVQHTRALSRKGKTVMCEEITDSRVTPSGADSHQELLKLDGRLLVKHKYVTYTQLPSAKKDDKAPVEADHDSLSIRVGNDDDTDRDLVENIRDHLINDKSKDGISKGLFPLTSKNQPDYQFKLLGREPRNGHDCFH